MKILYCMCSLYNPGGMERVLLNKVRYLKERMGWDVAVVTTDQHGKPTFYPFPDGVRIIDLGVNYTDDNGKNPVIKTIGYLWRRRKHRKALTELLLKERPDIVDSLYPSESSFIPSIKDGSKKVLELHFNKYFRLQYGRHGLLGLSDRLRTRQDEKIVRKFDSFVVLTEEDKGYWGEPHFEDIAWVKFGKPESQTRFANYPGDANLVNIYDLIDEIEAGTTTHCIISGDNVYTQAYVDEYFYNDKPYKDFVNTDDRILSFTIGSAKISADGHSTYIEGSGFTLQQKSIKTFYKDNVGNPFGFESVEETPAAAFTGDDDYPGTELQNGLKNTWEIINTKTDKTWSRYVNIAQNGFTGATPPTSANIMTTTGTNPMFECLSRNRDLNGDGTIDEDEVRWYLPSVRQCIFAWCGKKSLPTEISFETTNYATSTNLGFRIWWALEGTAISSWANMVTNPMIRCVRNLGTNSTSGEVSDITSWDQENYVVTVNGLKDETLRTNMQIGEYPEHENFDAASTLPKAFKIASADLNIPASGEDTYAPEITVGELNPTGIPESQSNTTPHNITVPIKITNYDASKNYTYQIGADNEVNVTAAEFNVSVTINLSSTNNGATASTTIKIKSDNGNYTSFNVTVTLTTRTEGFIFQTKYYTYTYSKSTPQQTIVTGGTPAKNTFKYTEIMNGDWCEKYYQEGTDDLGKWRIPNEKELYFIPMYCGEEITGNLAGYKPSGAQTETGTMRYAAKTKYNRNLIHDPSNPGNTFMIYYLQKDGSSGTPIVTTGHGQSDADFTIRCVRDAPQGTRSYDSSYSSGGTGFGL